MTAPGSDAELAADSAILRSPAARELERRLERTLRWWSEQTDQPRANLLLGLSHGPSEFGEVGRQLEVMFNSLERVLVLLGLAAGEDANAVSEFASEAERGEAENTDLGETATGLDLGGAGRP